MAIAACYWRGVQRERDHRCRWRVRARPRSWLDCCRRPVIIAFGALLLPIGVGLLTVSSRLSVSLVRGLASINGVSGIVIGAWLIATWAAFSPLGRVLAVLTVAGLIVLAIAELYISNITSST